MSYKISIFLPNLNGGGAERVCIDLAHGFSDLGCTAEFVLMSATGSFLLEAKAKFNVVDLGVKKARQAPLVLSRYLKAQRPAALVAHMWPLTTVAVAARALSGQHCKLLLVEHGTLSRQYYSWGFLHNLMLRGTLAANCRWGDQVATVSKGTAHDLAYLAGHPVERINVIYNPVRQRNWPQQGAMRMAEAFWNAPRGERILTVGNFKDEKNQVLLLHAFARIVRPCAKLMLVGHGENETLLRKLAFELGIAERVIFPGFYPDPSPFYATADLFALSSDHEGLPTVLIEALSFGLSVVSTDCPSGPAEILEHGRYGYLVPVGNDTLLAEAIGAALAAPANCIDQKRRSLDFEPKIAAKKYLDLLGIE
jgi:glycosyltransferase involved in cell wall biosynthesis